MRTTFCEENMVPTEVKAKCLDMCINLYDFYNEYITLPTFYKNHFNEIYVTDILVKDKY